MISFPNVNTISTVTNGTLYAVTPNFFCNGVPSLLMGDQYQHHLYIVPLTSGLPATLDISKLPQGTVTIIAQPNGKIYYQSVATNFQENGCDSIAVMDGGNSNDDDGYPLMSGVYMINGNENFPATFAVAEMLNSNQYGFVYQLSIHGGDGFGASTVTSGYFSSTTSHDISICLISNSWTAQSCSIIYHTADQFPTQINNTWVESNNGVGFNLVADNTDYELDIPSASNFAKQGAFITYQNDIGNGAIGSNFTIINPIAQGALSGNVLMSMLENKYAYYVVYLEDQRYDDDRRESPRAFNYATGDFNNNGVLDIFVALTPEQGGDFCLVGYMLYDLKNQDTDINLTTQGQPIYNFAAGTCYSLSRFTDQIAIAPSSADVNGDGITDLLLSGIAIYNLNAAIYSIAAYIAFGSDNGIADVLSAMTPAQGLNFNITAGSPLNFDLSSFGKIDQSGREAFLMNDENGVTHIMQLAGGSAEIVDHL